MVPLRVGVLISGRGSNLKALLDDLASAGAPARVVGVLCDRPEAAGLVHAAEAGVPCTVVDRRSLAGHAGFETALGQALEAAEVDLVCLAGFMRVLSDVFVRRWAGRMINIHPSLLPAYRGLRTHERAIADGAVESGCTVHAVTPELDGGPILAQRRVPVFADDTAATLAARVLEQEHRLYPKVVRSIAEGGLRVPRW